MMLLNCPNCGERNVSEFRYGGEFNSRPKDAMNVPEEEWVDFIYMRDNKVGVQKEWWYHRSGCATWFLAQRHTKSNEVIETSFWQPAGSEVSDE